MSEPGESEPRAPRPPWSHFREALESVGFHPSRRLGQNFLLDENAARAIARDAAVGQGDLVLVNSEGNGARQLFKRDVLPIRSLILAVVDQVHVGL